MRITCKTSNAGALMLLGLMLLAGAAFAEDVSHGRAGVATAADRIAQVVRDARPAGATSDQHAVTIYGQAGQPVGADAIEYVSRHARRSRVRDDAMAAGFGRAGGPAGRGHVRDDSSLHVAESDR